MNWRMRKRKKTPHYSKHGLMQLGTIRRHSLTWRVKDKHSVYYFTDKQGENTAQPFKKEPPTL